MTFLLKTDGFDGTLFEKMQKCENLLFSESNFPSKKNQSVAARVLLAYALKAQSEKKLSFYYGDNGKPYLKNSEAFFNISHSADYVICTLSDCEVGCDVQEIVEYKPKIAQRHFTLAEQEKLQSSKDKAELFTKLWALKESVLKKNGTGVSGGLSAHCFAPFVETDRFFSFGNHFSVFSLDGAYMAVCSHKSEDEPVTVTREDFTKYMDEILKGD